MRGTVAVFIEWIWEVIRGIVVGCAVTSGMHHEHAQRVGVADGVVNHVLLWGIALAEAHVDYIGAVVGSIADSIGHVFIALIAIGHRTDRHNAHRWGYAVDGKARVALSADNARYMGAVAGVGAMHIRIPVAGLCPVGIVIADDGARIERRVVSEIDLRVHPVVEVLDVLWGYALIVEEREHIVGLLGHWVGVFGNVCNVFGGYLLDLQVIAEKLQHLLHDFVRFAYVLVALLGVGPVALKVGADRLVVVE